MIINISPDSRGGGNRDGPESAIVLSVNDVYGLIGLKIKIYFQEEGSIGREQKKKGYAFGVLISLFRDADRKNFLFEIGVGPAYDQTHVFCLASDINLAKALADLANLKREKERLAFREKKSS